MGLFKKIFRPIKKAVDFGIDLVTDTAKAAINIVTSPFTGGFGVPDIQIPDTTADINQSLTVNYNASNSPIPVLYGRRVETSPIPVYVKVHGPKNDFLTVIGALGTGLGQSGMCGSFIHDVEIDNEMIGRTYMTRAANSSTYATLPDTGYPIASVSERATGDVYSSGISGYTTAQQNAWNTDRNTMLAQGFNGEQPGIYTPFEGRYSGRLKMQFFDGSDNQPVSSLARQGGSEWNFRMPGISYGVFQFQLFNEEYGDIYNKAHKNPYNGLPQIKVVIEGRNVPDIVSRPQAEDTIATDQWDTVFASGYQHQGVHNDYEPGFAPTTNPVHHLLDYMLNPYYGAGIPLAKFDKDSWVKAAQVCRVYRNYTSKTGLTGLFGNFFRILEILFKPSQGGFIDQQDGIIYNALRFFLKPTTSDGQVYPGYNESGKVAFINTPYNRQFKIYPSRSYLDNINLMLRSMGAIMTYVNGKFRIIMENGGNQQNSFDIPSVATLKSECDGDGRTFTDDDIVGNISLKGATLENTFNQVKVNYPDFEDKSKSNSQVYPEKGSTLYASLLEEDNNQELTAEITNTGIFMPRDALVYAKVTLEKSRNRETISFQTPDSNANIIPGDIIRVNSSYGGFDNLYRVTDVLLTVAGQIEITGIRHNPDDYDFEVDNFVDVITDLIRTREPIVNNQDTSIKAPEGVTINKIRRDAADLFTATTDMVVRWQDKSQTAGSNSYEISIEAVTQNNQNFGTRLLGETTSREFKIRAEEIPAGGSITIAVRSKSPSGSFSAKTLATSNNVPVYGTPLSNSLVPFDVETYVNVGSFSSGGPAAGGIGNSAGQTGAGEL
jgi:hypothetical protein